MIVPSAPWRTTREKGNIPSAGVSVRRVVVRPRRLRKEQRRREPHDPSTDDGDVGLPLSCEWIAIRSVRRRNPIRHPVCPARLPQPFQLSHGFSPQEIRIDRRSRDCTDRPCGTARLPHSASQVTTKPPAGWGRPGTRFAVRTTTTVPARVVGARRVRGRRWRSARRTCP